MLNTSEETECQDSQVKKRDIAQKPQQKQGLRNSILGRSSIISTILDENSFYTQYIIVGIVGLFQGVLNLSNIGLNYMYKDDFKLSPSQLQVISGLVNLPWIFKPVFGMISDSIPFFGYRRKSYLIASGILSFVCWNYLAFEITTNYYAGITSIVMNQICIAFTNVIGEALLVEISQKKAKILNLSDEDQQKEAARNVSLFFGIKSVGTLLTAYLGGYLLEIWDKHKIFAVTSVFSLFLAISALILQEEHEDQAKENGNHIKASEQIDKLKKFIVKPYIYKPILFIFLFMITPQISSAMFFYYTNRLGFEPEFLGELKLLYAVASLIGMAVYNKYLKFVEFKKLFVVTSFGCCIIGMSQIMLVTRQNQKFGIPDKVFCLGDSVIIQVIGEINTLPLLVLACRLCPKNIEGTMYAVVMSTLNFGTLIAQQLGGLLTYIFGITDKNFDNLWICILISNLTFVLPLVFINLVQLSNQKDIEDDVSNQRLGTYKPVLQQDGDPNKSFSTLLNESIDEIGNLIHTERNTI